MSQPDIYWVKIGRSNIEVRTVQGTYLPSIQDAAIKYQQSGWRVIEWGKYVSQPLSPEEMIHEPTDHSA